MNYLPNNVTELVKQLQLIPHPEGGFFRETYRSGSIPMTSRGITDTTTATYNDGSRSIVHVSSTTLSPTRASTGITDMDVKTGPSSTSDPTNETATTGTTTNTATDSEYVVVRNALTSIYWVPTIKSPKLILGYNLSDHVHYYHGGGYAFIYYIYTPHTGMLRNEILGPNLVQGHQLQVAVCSGEWKCGHIVPLDTAVCDEIGTSSATTVPYVLSHFAATPDYVIIGEGVGPGFDIHDFNWVTEDDINVTTNLSMQQKAFLKQYLHSDTTAVDNKEEDFDQHYDKNDATAQRVKERA